MGIFSKYIIKQNIDTILYMIRGIRETDLKQFFSERCLLEQTKMFIGTNKDVYWNKQQGGIKYM